MRFCPLSLIISIVCPCNNSKMQYERGSDDHSVSWVAISLLQYSIVVYIMQVTSDNHPVELGSRHGLDQAASKRLVARRGRARPTVGRSGEPPGPRDHQLFWERPGLEGMHRPGHGDKLIGKDVWQSDHHLDDGELPAGEVVDNGSICVSSVPTAW